MNPVVFFSLILKSTKQTSPSRHPTLSTMTGHGVLHQKSCTGQGVRGAATLGVIGIVAGIAILASRGQSLNQVASGAIGAGLASSIFGFAGSALRCASSNH